MAVDKPVEPAASHQGKSRVGKVAPRSLSNPFVLKNRLTPRLVAILDVLVAMSFDDFLN